MYQKGSSFLAAFILAIVASASTGHADHVPDGNALVVSITDGDTIRVQTADGNVYPVRYIGLDAPETRNPRQGRACYGAESTQANRALVQGAVVWLERERSDMDRQGRLLRHAWRDDDLVAAVLVAQGAAGALAYRRSTARAADLSAIDAEVRTAGRGLWATCAEPDGR